jgi:hypothetical protein
MYIFWYMYKKMCDILFQTPVNILTRPTIIKGLIDDWPALTQWDTQTKFATRMGHHKINSNRTSFAYGSNVSVTVLEYSLHSENEHIIVMNDNNMIEGEKKLFIDTKRFVNIPRMFDHMRHSYILSYGGGKRGVDMMRHCEAWLGIVSGSKVWYFSNKTNNDVSANCYETPSDKRIFSCNVSKGDVIYVPDMWWHATCNTHPYTIAFGTQCRGRDMLASFKEEL